MTIELVTEFFKTLYKYRSLVHALVVRELKARYRNSVLGFFWTFLNPLLLMSVYSLVFSVIAKMSMENYAVFEFCGLLPWLWFASSLQEGTSSIVAGRSLITKSMFPAEILPVVTVASNLINFILSIPILIIFLVFSDLTPTWLALLLPVIIFIQIFFTLGLTLMVSAVNVRFRDMQHLILNFMTLWFFLTPIIYPITQLPEKARSYIMLNPMAVFSLCYQKIFYYQELPSFGHLVYTLALSFVFLYLGIIVFNNYRDSFAEEV